MSSSTLCPLGCPECCFLFNEKGECKCYPDGCTCYECGQLLTSAGRCKCLVPTFVSLEKPVDQICEGCETLIVGTVYKWPSLLYLDIEYNEVCLKCFNELKNKVGDFTKYCANGKLISPYLEFVKLIPQFFSYSIRTSGDDFSLNVYTHEKDPEINKKSLEGLQAIFGDGACKLYSEDYITLEGK